LNTYQAEDVIAKDSLGESNLAIYAVSGESEEGKSESALHFHTIQSNSQVVCRQINEQTKRTETKPNPTFSSADARLDLE
jgi:hypothetical protein